MTADAITIKLPIDRYAYIQARNRYKGGDKQANPLGPALIERSAYVLTRFAGGRLQVTHAVTGKRYVGIVPPELAAYLERFRAGERIPETHTFELVLVSEA